MVVSDSKPELRVIGTSPVRPDGADKVTGRAKYGADFQTAGILYGKVKRSPHAHARILSIDPSKALALPGVHAVITAADFPDPGDATTTTYRGVEPLRWALERVIAGATALHRGHAVAAVCATDPHVAEDAADLIEVEYEVLTPVMNIADATAPDAPILHDPETVAAIDGLFDPIDGRPTNIGRRTILDLGDVEAGFAEADVVIEREYETSAAHQGYIEPPNGSAVWTADGKLTVWTSTQGHFAIRQALADLLVEPLSNIRVVPMEIGGGFGGKTVPYLEPIAAMLARKSGRPVKLSMSRTDVFESAGPTSGTICRVKLGAKQDGTIVAAEAHLAFESGAYPGAPYAAGAMCAFSPYAIPNQYVEGYDVVVNKPKVMAYRAPGAPAAEFGVEGVIDELAEQLDIDRVELRLMNSAVQGTAMVSGRPHGSFGGRDVLEATKATPHYRSELQGPNRGRGMASGFWFNGGGESSAYALLNADGTFNLLTGSVDIGGQRAGLAMQLAETMGVSYEDVNPQVSDTDSLGFTGTTGGSRTTFATGWAVYEAALDLQHQLQERAAKIWHVEAETVHYDADATLRGPDDENGAPRALTLQEIAKLCPSTGGMVQGRADTAPSTVGAAAAAHVVDLEVDPETGKVEILRYTALQDVGKAIHPAYVEGQIQGGAVQGIGMALTEEYVYDGDGAMRNASFLDYRMPTTLDVPEIETVLVEVPNPGHPYGVRGVGEVPIVPPLAAITNAIYEATGVRIRKLPASPTAILEALLAHQDA